MLTSIQWLNLAASNILKPRKFKQLFLSTHYADAVPVEFSVAERHAVETSGHTDRPSAMVSDWLTWQEKAGNRLLWLGDEDYPPLLLEMDDPPRLLFCHGRKELLCEPQIAVVGSRQPSAAGKEDAYLFAHALASNGLTVTSGMAAGIDGAAHRGALEAFGNTVAVLGCGIDRIYPREHANLYARIAARGLLVSEYPPGTGPKPYQFPVRNRIISALSLGVLVVEASVDSGSLITAKLALEQNREVFAMPGSIHNPVAKGCHKLLREGAKLVESVEDILEELNDDLIETIHLAAQCPDEAVPGRGRAVIVADRPTASVGTASVTEVDVGNGLSPALRRILDAVDWHQTRVEQVILRTGLPSSIVVAGLVELCLTDLVLEEQGKYLRR